MTVTPGFEAAAYGGVCDAGGDALQAGGEQAVEGVGGGLGGGCGGLGGFAALAQVGTGGIAKRFAFCGKSGEATEPSPVQVQLAISKGVQCPFRIDSIQVVLALDFL
jgi:hypothetical protein